MIIRTKLILKVFMYLSFQFSISLLLLYVNLWKVQKESSDNLCTLTLDLNTTSESCLNVYVS